jgi:cobalt/nickel transport system permease protein
MISEPFANGNSPVQKIDPRVKVIFVFIYSFSVALLVNFPALVIALSASIAMAFIARLGFRETIKRLTLANILILLLWLVLPLTFKGDAVFSIGPLAFTREGLLVSARITLKSNAILLALMALITTMSIATLGHAMSRLMIPDKIVSLFLITYRYIFVMKQEYERLLRAARARGFRPRTNIHTYRTYAYLVGMLLVRAVERAERVHKAMICRGFRGKFYSLREFSMSPLDWAWCIAMGALITVLELTEWTKIM